MVFTYYVLKFYQTVSVFMKSIEQLVVWKILFAFKAHVYNANRAYINEQ
jgi:hypothetical protein